MSNIKYLPDADVTEVSITIVPRYGQSQTGYGAKIPMRYRLRIAGRWHRVYMVIYSNSGSCYIIRKGKSEYLEPNTEYRMQDAAQ